MQRTVLGRGYLVHRFRQTLPDGGRKRESTCAFRRASISLPCSTQVTRVLSRLTALHAPATAKVTTNFIWALADVLVPPQSSSSSSDAPCLLEARCLNKPGAWNQGLMELGATVCTPKAPKCGECPLSEECLAYAEVSWFVFQRDLSKLPTCIIYNFPRPGPLRLVRPPSIRTVHPRPRRSLHSLLSN